VRYPLRESAVIMLNGSGVGVAKVGPLSSRETWFPTNISVSANAGAIKEAQCSVSVGDSNTLRFVDQTFTGSAGDSTSIDGSTRLRAGEFVWATWTGGDANVQAMLLVVGTKEL
jgi:hypothetical protein